MNLIDEFKSDASGLAIIKDWLGAGGIPVHPLVADRRAKVCASCPLNVSPNWWSRIKHKIADEIKKQIEFKNRIGLKVDCEESIHMCKACGCCNRLSVWTPIIHIAHHTTTEKLAEFDKDCWKRKEIKETLQDK